MTMEKIGKVTQKLAQEVKKSTLQAQSEYEFDLIMRKHPCLVPVTLLKTESGITFEFQTSGLTCLAEAKKLSELDVLRTLMNALCLYELYQGLKFDLNPKNLYQDIGLHVKVAYRDVYAREDIVDEESFVKEYLCLLAALMQNKYTYEEVKESGNDLLTKDKKTKPFADLKQLAEIEATLIDLFIQTKKLQDRTLMAVSKKQFKRLTWISRIAIVTTVIFCALSVYVHFYHNQFLQVANEGFSAYIRSDFVTTVDELSELNINRMDHMMMYTLASAYIRTEALTSEQRDNILASVTPASTERVLEFWVRLAGGDYEEAIDIARLLEDDEYLIYGYLRKRARIELDPSLSGVEREAELEIIDRQLDQFTIQHEQALEED